MAFVARFVSHVYERILGSRPVEEEEIPAVQRDTCYPNGTKKGCIVSYYATGQGRVDIPETLNPWQVLDLHSFHVSSSEEIDKAFKVRITQSVRHNSAMASVAYHMLTSTADRYVQKSGLDEFAITKADHFVLAACGHTRALASEIRYEKDLLQDKDERSRTLLYIASRSGFYDMCELLLEKGACINEVQSTGSTPLHGAAYYGHAQIVGLLLQHGAKTDIKNQFGRTALDESATPEIQRLIQTASTDKILSLTAEFRGKHLVHSVQLIKYQGEVIAKELARDQSTLDKGTRAQWNDICSNWESAWHGTRYGHLESIIKQGLVLGAGSRDIKPEAGLYELSEEHLGASNWAKAIFLTPCILFASHEAYSERVFSESQLWCVLVKAYCKPGSYKSYSPEMRVPVKDFLIWRVESARDVIVCSLMFVRCSFLENKHMNLDEKMRILGQEKKSSTSCSVS
ncbi:transient receptor potential cation channel subfamily A member 1-like [Orbicella faveolata]|uniref:transient receptor potential cation channel subfamily A member 1-like n=1 Tax=Orbicella faveolata TaxID=48498 RepID=UPI0009E1BB56|nr:transient receptor potential cation channel subfamily A member 1-like [Orbicella faveolata]